eukprot:scaffold1.g5361.t1
MLPPPPQIQPLSQAVRQLEAAVTASSLSPDVLAANQQALATLKTFLEGLRSPDGYPAASMRTVRFGVQRGPRLMQAKCQLKTTGGDCSRLVATNLGRLLEELGIRPSHFWFDGGEFAPSSSGVAGSSVGGGSKRAGGGGASEAPAPEKVAAVRAQAAAAGFPSQTITEEEFRQLEQHQADVRAAREGTAEARGELADMLKGMEQLLATASFIGGRVLDELEGAGWDLRGAVVRIWAGEREARHLVAGKDDASREAIKLVLWHALQYDSKHGHKTC